jgi:hypothetical protein
LLRIEFVQGVLQGDWLSSILIARRGC